MADEQVSIAVIKDGNTAKPDPFTVCIIANPALEAPWGSGQFLPDQIVGARGAFDSCAAHIVDCLYGSLPGQGEMLLAPPDIRDEVRIVTLFVAGAGADDSNSLVGQDAVSNILVPRRAAFAPFMNRHGIVADIAYAVSSSASHARASAWFTSDDDGRSGVAFQLDGIQLFHRHFCLVPGTIAIHVDERSLTALHEFQHALSSYSNGKIVDLYVDGSLGVNKKRARPIPPAFGTYRATQHASDPMRDGLGYPAGWGTFHCGLHLPSSPAVMDNYFQGASPLACQNDTVTRQFLLDRLRAKVSR